MGMKRVFVAIEIPEAIRRDVVEYMSVLRSNGSAGVRWIPPQNLHLTLKFAGSIDDAELAALQSAVSSLAGQTDPFEVCIEGTGSFVNGKSRSGVLWLGVHSHSVQARTTGIIEGLMASLGDERRDARRGSKPHLTIARMKEPEAAGDLRALHVASKAGPHSFTPEELVVYESILTRSGPVYTPLSRHTIGGHTTRT
jgi:RNA 2',3'-cyclic 3'-phosphodiesterase